MTPSPRPSRGRAGRLTIAAAVTSLALAGGAVAASAGATAAPQSAPAAAQSAPAAQAKRAKAKNVIIFVGDGMGASHRTFIQYVNVGPGAKLEMDSMPIAGRSQTFPHDPKAMVTDSAAGGTALATGVKTYNGAIGVDVDGKPVQSVLELAAKHGKSTGLVTTSQVTDATPAAFGAHVKDRGEQSLIAKQFLEISKPQVILGGGEDRWLPPGTPGAFPDAPAENPKEKSSGTEGNLIEKAQQLGYAYVSDAAGLKATTSNKILGLFANEEMFQQNPEGQGDIYDPIVSLPDMTSKAISTLSRNKKGFFLMVEEEGIDEMAHKSNATMVAKAGKQLDDAVSVAKRFAQKHGDTLVIVVADHATGGLAIEDVPELQDDPGYPNERGEGRTAEDGPFSAPGTDRKFMVDWTTSNHTAEDVPLTAMGPGSQLLSGVYPNTHVHDVMVRAMGLRR
ncbi:alkaline phosphatase [Kineosphaera limosa]|uniref:Alkaline phosphatase n=1 Tax=Kineosphaera limosa NBRC 100340 TaxID=1184609 RepID=K6WSB6_9MICO|nr:alkaline phosphatase [Kineosphaera limosa]NYE00537.1 alkaline phosphatase [Kineosphaera limosa]GAB94997.1 alkaline phosphatase [Kineosphaera limosa NBRC 100340]